MNNRPAFTLAEGVRKGAYALADIGSGKPQIIRRTNGLVSRRRARGWLFAEQDEAYRGSVLLSGVELRVAVEAGIAMGWQRRVGSKGRIQSIDQYGASGPANIVFENFGFSAANIEKIAWDLLRE